jgi:hypothetical protein
VFNNEDFWCAFIFDFLWFFLFFCLHFLHFLLPPIVDVDISDIAIIYAYHGKVSESVLHHWIWTILKNKTQLFAPLHKVFAKIKVDSTDCGTTTWTQIFLMHPVTSDSITHKLLASGLKTCLGFKDDSLVFTTDYIASINASASQLSYMIPMTVPDFCALVTLMGLYLSEASGHQKGLQRVSRPR